MKDTKSLLLALMSTGLVATWVYHIYDKANYSNVKTKTTQIDSSAIKSAVRDSLQRIYSGMIDDKDLKLDSSEARTDSLKALLTSRLSEISRLKSEIRNVLVNPNSSKQQLEKAKEKMAELEGIVTALRQQNSTMETDKFELSARLDKATGEVAGLEQNITKLDEENKVLKEKIRQAALFEASALHFSAIDLRSDKEVPTAQSKKADKFVASFVLRNNLEEFRNAEVFVVITEPAGKTLQNSTWESGAFETRKGSKKDYTRKVKFDYEKGEQKRILFSLDVGEFQSGKYTFQVWQDGMLIGETAETLK